MIKPLFLLNFVTLFFFAQSHAFVKNSEIHRIVGNNVNLVFDLSVKDNCLDANKFKLFKKTFDNKTLRLKGLPKIRFVYDSSFKCMDIVVRGSRRASLKTVEVEGAVARPDLTYWSLNLGNGTRLFITQENIRSLTKSGKATFQVGDASIENSKDTISTIRGKILFY